jgi:hypothetical protein
VKPSFPNTKSTAERVCDSRQGENLTSQFAPLDKFFEGWRAISVEPDAIRGKEGLSRTRGFPQVASRIA